MQQPMFQQVVSGKEIMRYCWQWVISLLQSVRCNNCLAYCVLMRNDDVKLTRSSSSENDSKRHVDDITQRSKVGNHRTVTSVNTTVAPRNCTFCRLTNFTTLYIWWRITASRQTVELWRITAHRKRHRFGIWYGFESRKSCLYTGDNSV